MANVSSSNGLEKYPKLRFKGFSEPWKVVRIGEVYAERSERGAEDMELLSVTMNDGVKMRSDIEGKDNSSEDKSNYKIVRSGDMVYNSMRMWQGANGISPWDGIVSPAYTVLKPRIPLSNDFFAALFKTYRLINEFRKNSQGMTSDTWNLKYPQIETIKTFIPSLPEQERIATFLTTLDRRVEKQRVLVEHLKKYKRGVIKEFLTPQTCPIKNAVWSKATIGELGTFVKGAPLSKADISDEGVPFILYGELYTTYGEVINKVVRKTQRSVDNVYLSCIGDVLIPTSGETPEEISTASCVMVSDVILAGDLNIFRTSKVDGRIMSYVLNHIVNSNIARIAQGKSVVHIQASEISKIGIFYPDENTQQQLITVFGGISEKITLAEDALAKMIMLKKSIIQKMFI